MNHNEFYERHDPRVQPEVEPAQPPNEDAHSALAVHRDPSVPVAESPAPATQRNVAWVRPSEFPTLLGSTWVGRGIDLQAELARRSRRGPIKAVRATRRTSRAAIARTEAPAPTATTTEELEL